jgi:hypothetical protein
MAKNLIPVGNNVETGVEGKGLWIFIPDVTKVIGTTGSGNDKIASEQFKVPGDDYANIKVGLNVYKVVPKKKN